MPSAEGAMVEREGVEGEGEGGGGGKGRGRAARVVVVVEEGGVGGGGEGGGRPAGEKKALRRLSFGLGLVGDGGLGGSVKPRVLELMPAHLCVCLYLC